MSINLQNCPDIHMVNGHIILPEIMADSADLAKSLIRAGRAEEVQAEIERREYVRSPEFAVRMREIHAREKAEREAHLATPEGQEEKRAFEARMLAQRQAEARAYNRRQMRFRTKYPQHAEHFRLRDIPQN